MAIPPTIPPRRRRGGITFPILLIVVGTLFLLNQMAPAWELKKTWPVILIAWGVGKLVDAIRPLRPPEGPRV